MGGGLGRNLQVSNSTESPVLVSWTKAQKGEEVQRLGQNQGQPAASTWVSLV